MKKEIRFFKKSEKPLLLDAIEKLWKHNHIYVRNPTVLEHLTLNTPWRAELAGEENYSFVGMWVDDELVGLNGVIPLEGNILGERVRAKTGTIWMTKKVTGKAVNGLDMGAFVDDIWDTKMLVGMGLSKTAQLLEELRGSYIVDNMNRWILVIDKEMVTEHLLADKEMSSYFPTASVLDFQRRYTVDVDMLSKESWDKYYFDVIAPKTIGICKSYKFLKWRYMESPVLKYHFLSVKDKAENCLGLAVIRIEPILDGQFSIGRVLEFLSFDVGASVELARGIVDFDKNVLLWDFYCFSDVTAFGLESIGFRKLPPWNDKIKIPSRFHPIDHEIMELNGFIHLTEEYRDRINPLNLTQWYVTRGDTDQDRAN